MNNAVVEAKISRSDYRATRPQKLGRNRRIVSEGGLVELGKSYTAERLNTKYLSVL